MKKFIITLSILCIAFVIGISSQELNAYAKEKNKLTPKNETALGKYTSRSAYLIDYDTETVLFERNADAKYPIASMVKIMTLNITFDEIENGNLSLNEKICISETASGMGGSQMFLDTGLEYTVSDLIKGVVVVSANDASVALAERISGNVDTFIALMNSRAKDYGMLNTNFVNVTGLPEDGQYSTAKDVSKMMKNLLKRPQYYDFSKIFLEDYTHPDGRITTLTNTNKLVRFYKGCDGGKTGFTNDAMFCLSATALRNDTRVIATVLGAPTSKDRNKEITELFNYAFANYKTTKILQKGQPIPTDISIKRSKTDSVELSVDKDICLLVKKNDIPQYEIVYELNDNLKAPIEQNSIVGKIKIVGTKTKDIIEEANLITLNKIENKSYLDSLIEILENWYIKN